MDGPVKSTALFRQKALREFKEMAGLSLYLYICLGVVVLLKAAILQGRGSALRNMGHRSGKGPPSRKIHASWTRVGNLEIDGSSGQFSATH
jgi:hypothetical protein